jgi:acyl-CoA synthetase
MHSDNTLLANGRALVHDWGHTAESVILTLSPLSHHIATVAVAQWLAAGAELAVNAPGPGRPALEWIEETGATYVMGVPTHAMDLLSQVQRTGRAGLGRVRVFYMAGAPIPSGTAQRFLRMNVTPQNVYGMSENGSHNYTLPADDARTITETCGRPGQGYEIRIFDQNGPNRELPAGEVGEIGGRGAVLMLGYWGDQAATEAGFNASGWFLSGDLGRLDERGCLSIVGRKKDLIIRGGHNIHPARIEELALRHPGVLKAAAFAVPDERLGEKVCLAVIPAPGQSVPAPALLEHLHAAGLSTTDMPEYFVQLDAFPLTASGKILKRELAGWARSGRIRPEPVRWSAAGKRGSGNGGT